MGYNYNFDVGTIFFFGLTIFFYLRQKRLHDLQDSIFTAMLICGMTSVVFDFAAAAMEMRAMLFPVWLICAVNIIFIFSMQSCLPLFFVYSVASAGRFGVYTRAKRILSFLPFALTNGLLLLSPFVSFGIFFVDENHIYNRGPLHIMLYINMAVYVAASLFVLLRNLRTMQRTKRNVIFLFVGLLFASVVLQMAFPRYLLTASATALALTSVFYVLQSPVDQTDPFTGAFSRTLLPSLLADYRDRGKPYTLLLYALRNFDDVVNLYGGPLGDSLLKTCAAELQRYFHGDAVVYMDTSEFVVVRSAALSRAEIDELCESVPKTTVVDDIRVPLEIGFAAIPFDERYSHADVSTADYLFMQLRSSIGGGALYADEEYKKSVQAMMELEFSIGEQFDGSGLALSLDPIVTADGGFAGDEARLALTAERFSGITGEQLLRTVGLNGYIWRYYDRLLLLLEPRRDKYRPECRAHLPLSAAAFIQEDARERLSETVSAHGFEARQLTFTVSEAELASALPSLFDNMRALAADGYEFMIDSFAAGYTDLSLVASLPIAALKLHGSLVANAKPDTKQEALLAGLIDISNTVGKRVVCGGVDCEEDRAAALDAGATLLQGKLYSPRVF